jgi:hypothetical protein
MDPEVILPVISSTGSSKEFNATTLAYNSF